jgi:hypothetical protein
MVLYMIMRYPGTVSLVEYIFFFNFFLVIFQRLYKFMSGIVP